jgi:hypothetical protein
MACAVDRSIGHKQYGLKNSPAQRGRNPARRKNLLAQFLYKGRSRCLKRSRLTERRTSRTISTW